MKLAVLIFISAIAIVVSGVATFLFYARFSDGPKGPIPGGALVTGDLIDAADVRWEELLRNKPVTEIQLQLENPTSSRTTGAFIHDGELYVPCDLGYVWRRLPAGTLRLVLHTIWMLKDWHQKAAIDGRVVARIDGKRFKLNAVRVTDEALLGEFRERVSSAAGEVFELLPVETDPEDIWFFRLDAHSDDAG